MAEETSLSALVLETLTKYPGKLISIGLIADELSGQADRRQVSNAIGTLARNRNRPDVVTMGRGTVMYLPSVAPAGHNGSEPEPEPEPVHVAMEPTVDEVKDVLKGLEVRGRGLPEQARKNFEATVENITPEIAAHWLTANKKNRDLRPSRVVWLAGIINRGDEWQLTTDGIGFDTAGMLRNGQHRLSAIVVSGKTVPMVVVRGLKPKAQDVMDKNLTRSIADALKLRGENYTAALGAALSWLYRLDYMEQVGQIHFRNPGERPTSSQLLRLLDENPEIRDAVRDYAREAAKSEVPLRSGVFSALWYRFRLVDKVEANLFVQQLLDGSNLAPDNPILVLRKLLISDAQRGYERMPDYREAAFTVKAWNAWREQVPTQRLTFKYGPLVKEPFPHIH